MGIAIRMAALMQLHREETYYIQDPTRDDLMKAESARRTLVRTRCDMVLLGWIFTDLSPVDAT
jgi:hypothetical protein